jgi:lipid-A-disaccharide synthase-like uncharacterized protein
MSLAQLAAHSSREPLLFGYYSIFPSLCLLMYHMRLESCVKGPQLAFSIVMGARDF